MIFFVKYLFYQLVIYLFVQKHSVHCNMYTLHKMNIVISSGSSGSSSTDSNGNGCSSGNSSGSSISQSFSSLLSDQTAILF